MVTQSETHSRQIEYPRTEPPEVLEQQQKDHLVAEIKDLLKRNNAVMVAHYYTDPVIQA